MKRKLLAVILLPLSLVLVLPAAFADSYPIPFSYTGEGDASGTFNSTWTTSMTLTGINCFNGGGICGGDLGTIAISGGTLLSGICGTDCLRADGATVIITDTSGALLFKGTFNAIFRSRLVITLNFSRPLPIQPQREG